MDLDQTQAITFHSSEDEQDDQKLVPKAELKLINVPKEYLVIDPPSSFPLYLGENIIGRDKSCPVFINSKVLSKKHAVISIEKHSYLICDLGSKNKTQKDKLLLKPNIQYELQPNNSLFFGNVEALFHVDNNLENIIFESESESMLDISNAENCNDSEKDILASDSDATDVDDSSNEDKDQSTIIPETPRPSNAVNDCSQKEKTSKTESKQKFSPTMAIDVDSRKIPRISECKDVLENDRSSKPVSSSHELELGVKPSTGDESIDGNLSENSENLLADLAEDYEAANFEDHSEVSENLEIGAADDKLSLMVSTDKLGDNIVSSVPLSDDMRVEMVKSDKLNGNVGSESQPETSVDLSESKKSHHHHQQKGISEPDCTDFNTEDDKHSHKSGAADCGHCNVLTQPYIRPESKEVDKDHISAPTQPYCEKDLYLNHVTAPTQPYLENNSGQISVDCGNAVSEAYDNSDLDEDHVYVVTQPFHKSLSAPISDSEELLNHITAETQLNRVPNFDAGTQPYQKHVSEESNDTDLPEVCRKSRLNHAEISESEQIIIKHITAKTQPYREADFDSDDESASVQSSQEHTANGNEMTAPTQPYQETDSISLEVSDSEVSCTMTESQYKADVDHVVTETQVDRKDDTAKHPVDELVLKSDYNCSKISESQRIIMKHIAAETQPYHDSATDVDQAAILTQLYEKHNVIDGCTALAQPSKESDFIFNSKQMNESDDVKAFELSDVAEKDGDIRNVLKIKEIQQKSRKRIEIDRKDDLKVSCKESTRRQTRPRKKKLNSESGFCSEKNNMIKAEQSQETSKSIRLTRKNSRIEPDGVSVDGKTKDHDKRSTRNSIRIHASKMEKTETNDDVGCQSGVNVDDKRNKKLKNDSTSISEDSCSREMSQTRRKGRARVKRRIRKMVKDEYCEEKIDSSAEDEGRGNKRALRHRLTGGEKSSPLESDCEESAMQQKRRKASSALLKNDKFGGNDTVAEVTQIATRKFDDRNVESSVSTRSAVSKLQNLTVNVVTNVPETSSKRSHRKRNNRSLLESQIIDTLDINNDRSQSVRENDDGQSETFSRKVLDVSKPVSSSKNEKKNLRRGSASVCTESNVVGWSPRRRKLPPTSMIKVMFTGTANKDVNIKVIKDLGGNLTDNVAECSLLVADEFKRTIKMMCCVAQGKPIVSSRWIKSCKSQNKILDTENFILEDKLAEKKFNFNLKTCLELSSQRPLLCGYKIHVTRNVEPPPAQMKDIIRCAGAKYLSSVPTGDADDRALVISCEKDKGKLTKSNIKIVTNEFLLTGLLHYSCSTR